MDRIGADMANKVQRDDNKKRPAILAICFGSTYELYETSIYSNILLSVCLCVRVCVRPNRSFDRGIPTMLSTFGRSKTGQGNE